MNLREHKFIVFGVEHYNPLGIIRSLGENNIRPIVIIVNEGKTVRLASKSKYISKLHLVRSIEEGYSVLMEKYSLCDNLPFLLAANDKTMSFFDLHYDDLKDKFYFFNAGAAGRISYYMNKDNINQLAIKYGLNVLKAIVVNKGEIPEGLEYPVITKSIASTVGAWKKDVFICYSKEELIDAYKKIKSPQLLLQRYIEKKNEYCLEGFSVNHGKDSFISIVSTYNYILEDRYSPYMTVHNFNNWDLKKKIDRMLSEIGFEGIFETEFLIGDNEELYFLEINFRNSTWSYASTCAGMPLPVLWAKYMLNGEINKNCYRKIPRNFTAMVEPEDYHNRVRGKKIGFIKWMIELITCDCRYYLGKNDIKPMVSRLRKKV